MKSTHQRVIYTFIKRMARRLRGATLLERVLVVLTAWLTALLLGAGLLPLASTQPLVRFVSTLAENGARPAALDALYARR